jgi:hypothetical protein
MWFPDFLLAAAGLALLVFGVVQLRKKELLEDTPTSTIRGVAMGTAELVGKAVERTPLMSILTCTRCVWWRHIVEEERTGSKGEKRWVKVREGTSTDLFYLDDGTGRLAVDPIGAEMKIGFKRQWLGSQLTEGLDPGEGAAWGRLGGLLAGVGVQRRYTEWLILPTAKLYVFGFVKNTRDACADRRERLTQALRELKADRARLMAFDADGDGRISEGEWDRAVEAVQRQLTGDDLASSRPGAADPDSMMVCRGPEEKTYIISDSGEKGAVRGYAWSGYAGLFVGAALFLLGAESLLARLGVIQGGWSVPWGAFMAGDRY